MKRILAVYYSQTGQLGEIMESIVAPLRTSPACSVTVAQLKPQQPYAFPWSFWGFFDTLPECVYDDPPPIEPLPLGADAEFDLIILGYQVWFISPSLPTTAFLQSEQARRLLRGKPVITVVACRNMWLMAQERVKRHLQALGATLVDHVAITERTHGAASVVTTPWWLLTGDKGPYLGGLFPRAGIWPADIAGAGRFGKRIADEFPNRVPGDARPMLAGEGAVVVHPGLIGSEHVAQRSFRIWGALLRACGKPGAPLRRLVLAVYVVFLVVMLLTVVPLVFVVKTVLAALTRQRIAEQRRYFAAPSGE